MANPARLPMSVLLPACEQPGVSLVEARRPFNTKTITSNMIRMQEDFKTTVIVTRSPLEQVINKLSIHYDRNWTQNGDNAYKAISKAEDTASITAYGEKEKPELFFFDFVNLSAMANDVRDFYLARYKNPKKIIEMEVFLDNSELEFADAITITLPLKRPCWVKYKK